MKKDNWNSTDFLYDYFYEFESIRFRLVSDDLFLREIDFCKEKNLKASSGDAVSAPVKLMLGYLEAYFRNGREQNYSVLFRHNGTDIMVLKAASSVASIVLDMEGYTEKEVAVYRELIKIKPGATISYGELAAKCGVPGGARFIGNTMAKNRFPVIIPCHRVVKSNGKMGNYSGGVDIKEKLLRHESIC